MKYGIGLYFDGETEKKIMKLPCLLASRGITRRYLDMRVRPHIALAVFNDIEDVDRCSGLLAGYAESVGSFPVKFSSIGVFNNSKIVFLAPVVTFDLLEMNRKINDIFCFCDNTGSEYYLPGSWVPHCAVALTGEDDSPVLDKAAKLVIDNFEVISGRVVAACLAEISAPVKELSVFDLKG